MVTVHQNPLYRFLKCICAPHTCLQSVHEPGIDASRASLPLQMGSAAIHMHDLSGGALSAGDQQCVYSAQRQCASGLSPSLAMSSCACLNVSQHQHCPSKSHHDDPRNLTWCEQWRMAATDESPTCTETLVLAVHCLLLPCRLCTTCPSSTSARCS